MQKRTGDASKIVLLEKNFNGCIYFERERVGGWLEGEGESGLSAECGPPPQTQSLIPGP